MPELPEVETVVRELKSLIPGKIVRSVEPVWSKSYDDRSSAPVAGQTVEKIGRKGKYIIVHLSKSFLVVHLRMTGQLLFHSNGSKDIGAHVRALIHFSDGTALHFKDIRKFGRIYRVDDDDVILKKVGTDALDPGLTKEWFVQELRKSRMNVKGLLLSQKLISGVGNIYADESLFRAGIHPESIAQKIPQKRAVDLFDQIRTVLRGAVENMGTTISDYRDSYGNKGKNQNFLKVYQQTGKSCAQCGRPVLKMRLAGRGTHLCGHCQKKYT